MNRRPAIADGVWLLCFGLVSTIWCLYAAAALGPTFDEPIYLRCGLEHWHTGSYKQLMRLGTMPLAVDVQTLAIHLCERWRGASLPFAEALRLARMASLIFWWILLIYTLRGGRMIAGHWGGRIAVALLACEPVVLGHAALANSDIPVTACLLVLAVEFRAGRESKWPRRVLLPAILYGLAILAKASALVFGPLCLLAIEGERLWRTGVFSKGSAALRDTIRGTVVDVAKIVAGGLGVTFLYCGSDWTTERTFVEWAQTLPAGKLHDAMLWTSQHLRIFTNAGEGLVQQIKHNIRGHGTFILGQEYRRAIWFYFPLTLTIKLTLALLATPFVLLGFRRNALLNWACVIAAGLFFYSVTCRVQIGIRFMLPLITFLCVGLGAAAAASLRELQGWKRTALLVWLVAAISSSAFSAIRSWPNGICFTNLAWGGTANGYRLLSDSNYDWGQGLPDLRRWSQQHGGEELDVWYFGTDPSVHEAPLRELPLHRLPGERLTESINGKLVAVSTTLLYGSYTAQSPAREAVQLFRSHRPIGRTITFMIYDFRGSSQSGDAIEQPGEAGRTDD
ncbi:MAG TPA: hypothetical protein VGM62_09360 [Chthoniobacterales bacterium]|jgi:hypothetical protein